MESRKHHSMIRMARDYAEQYNFALIERLKDTELPE